MCGEGVTDMQTELTLSELAVQQAELLPERETLFLYRWSAKRYPEWTSSFSLM